MQTTVSKTIKANEFGEIKIIDGRFGPYIKFGKKNYKIPKGINPESLDEKACQKIISEPSSRSKKGGWKKNNKWMFSQYYDFLFTSRAPPM